MLPAEARCLVLTPTDDGGILIYARETHHGAVSGWLRPMLAPRMREMH
ncbi:hypothetical protein [Mycobacterium palustre]|nr:hypothetical protein [Mycobacterium palustre]MCV7102273.1 hypothetical protein [Mycobacterium palustre]